MVSTVGRGRLTSFVASVLPARYLAHRQTDQTADCHQTAGDQERSHERPGPVEQRTCTTAANVDHRNVTCYYAPALVGGVAQW